MKSRFATLKAGAHALYQSEEVYRLANGTYTTDMTALEVIPGGCTIGTDKAKCTYPWGYCEIVFGSQRLHCENTQTLQNGYVIYWGGEHKGINCWAFSSNKTDKYNQLCKQEGGTWVSGGTCSGKGSCQIYKL